MVQLLRRDLDTPLGPALGGVVVPGDSDREPGGVCLLELGPPDRRARVCHELETHFGAVFLADAVAGGSPMLDRLQCRLDAYFAGRPDDDADLPLCTPGTRFQHQVWNAIRAIPLGRTISYAELAERAGHPSTAARAAGAAAGSNRVSILIPCHRVTAAGFDPDAPTEATLRGYAGGLTNKRALLEHERRLTTPSLFTPR